MSAESDQPDEALDHILTQAKELRADKIYWFDHDGRDHVMNVDGSGYMVTFGPDYWRSCARHSSQPDWFNLMAELDVRLCSRDCKGWTLDFNTGLARHLDCKGGTMEELLKRFQDNVFGGILVNGQPIARRKDG